MQGESCAYVSHINSRRSHRLVRNIADRTIGADVYIDRNEKYVFSVNGEPASEEQMKILNDALSYVPANAKSVVSDLSRGSTVGKLQTYGVWWSSPDYCAEMDGKYMVLPFELDIGGGLEEFVKRCTCAEIVKCSTGNCSEADKPFVYHVEDMHISDILRINRYVSLLITMFLRLSPDARHDMIEYTLDKWLDFGGSGNIHIANYNYLSLREAISVRWKLSKRGIPSLLVQDFSGSYSVLRSIDTDDKATEMDVASLYLDNSDNIMDSMIDDLDDIAVGWSSNSEWIGFA